MGQAANAADARFQRALEKKLREIDEKHRKRLKEHEAWEEEEARIAKDRENIEKALSFMMWSRAQDRLLADLQALREEKERTLAMLARISEPVESDLGEEACEQAEDIAWWDADLAWIDEQIGVLEKNLQECLDMLASV